MEDAAIVALYWARDEQALAETAAKFGAYCRKIADNILHSAHDAEECENDTWLAAWNSMPTNRPARLAPYLGRITRNLALDRFDRAAAQKRGIRLRHGMYLLLQGQLFCPDLLIFRQAFQRMSSFQHR